MNKAELELLRDRWVFLNNRLGTGDLDRDWWRRLIDVDLPDLVEESDEAANTTRDRSAAREFRLKVKNFSSLVKRDVEPLLVSGAVPTSGLQARIAEGCYDVLGALPRIMSDPAFGQREPPDTLREPSNVGTAPTDPGDQAPVKPSAPIGVGTQVGHYRLSARLGGGAMGVVYRAEHLHLGNVVAIKVIEPGYAATADARSRFKLEAFATSKTGHPNIIRVIDYGVHGDGSQYLVVEHLLGETLGDRSKRARLDLPDALHVARQISAALAAAHQANVIHRDLKPGNVFLVEQNDDPLFVKVLDFGLAKLLDAHEHIAHRTQTGHVLGTPAYMSPEQFKGVSVDARSDIYALGVMIFELVTGQLPFRGKSYAELVLQHAMDPAPRARTLAPNCPAWLEELIDQMLAKDPSQRPTSMSDVEKRLKAESTSRPSNGLAEASTLPAILPVESTLPASRSPATTLRSKADKSLVVPVSTTIAARPKKSFAARRNEILDAVTLRFAYRVETPRLGTQTLAWPAPLQRAPEIEDGTRDFVWTASRSDGANRQIVEYFRAKEDGSLEFARSVAWDDPLVVVEFEDLAIAAVCFLRFAALAYSALRRKTGTGESAFDIHASVAAPIRGTGAVAKFSLPEGYVLPLDRFRTAKLRRSPITASLVADADSYATSRTAVARAAHRLLDGFAEEFEFEPDEIAGRSPLLSIDAASVERLAVAILDD